MPKVLHLVLTDRVNGLLVDLCSERLDQPSKTAVVRELLGKALADFERARAKRLVAESKASILAARAQRMTRVKRPLRPRPIPPWAPGAQPHADPSAV